MPEGHNHFYEFGSFRINPAELLLLKDGQPVRLPPKTFELLLFFVQRSNQVIDKETLMREVWHDAFVEDANLTVHISTLRKIFAEDPEKSVSIETFPKRGYRFTGNVREIPAGFADPVDARFEENPALKDSAQPVRTDKKRIFIALLIFVGVIALSGYVLSRWSSGPASKSLNITRVPGTEKSIRIAVSPNGEYLAHVATGAQKQSLHILHIATKSSVQLIPPDAVEYDPLTFSNDGNYIYYVPRGNAGAALHRIPILGGEPKKVLENVAGGVGFSPDGTQFAFVRNTNEEETAVMIANTDGSGVRAIAVRKSPEFFSTEGLSWSPDGKLIACAVGLTKKDRMMKIVVLNPESGEEQMLSGKKWHNAGRVAWLPDGSGLLVSAFETGDAPTQIWFLPFPAGEPFTITNDLNNYGDISLTSDSGTLATIQFRTPSKIWLIPGDGSGEPRSVTDGKYHIFKFVSWTRDGRILFGSSAEGSRDVWIMDADGTNQKQLTSNARENGQPTTTPDNRQIVFMSDRVESGTYNIWKMNIDGTDPVQLTFGSGEIQPITSPDGKWIVYTNGGTETPPAKRTIWKIPFEGGEPVQIVSKPSHRADISPDGKHIACWYKPDESTPWKIAVVPFEGGESVKVFDITPTSPLHWTPDGSAISFVKTVDAVSNIWNQPLNGEPPVQITRFTSEQIINFDWSPDNRLICSRSHIERDIVLISNFR